METFELQPLPARAKISLAAIATGCLALAWLTWSVMPTSSFFALVAVATPVALAALMVWLGFPQSPASVTVAPGKLVLSMPIYGRAIELSQIELDSIASANLATDARYRATWRTNGLGVPGFDLGWFRTAFSPRTLMYRTAENAFVCNTKAGALILSVADPERLARAVKAAVTSSERPA